MLCKLNFHILRGQAALPNLLFCVVDLLNSVFTQDKVKKEKLSKLAGQEGLLCTCSFIATKEYSII